MLSNNNISDTRIQQLLDGVFFCRKRAKLARAAHSQNGFDLYTGGNFKQNTWKKRRKSRDHIYDHDMTKTI